MTPGCFYFNLLKEREYVAKGQTLFTSTVNLIVGLDESLDMLLENGLEADIIAVKGNPLEDVSRLSQVGLVMKGGVIYRQP